MVTNRHIGWIDDARTLTMLLVIIGHCTYLNIMTPYGGISYFKNVPSTEYSILWKLLTAMVTFIYTFHMPLFMMLSGACFSLTLKKVSGMLPLLKNKGKRLLIPFLFTALLVSIPLKYVSGYYAHSANVLHDIVLGQLLLMGNSHLWFVFSLFWIFLLYYGLYKLKVTTRWFFMPVLVCLSLSASIMGNKGIEFMGIIAAFKHLFYFAFGLKYLYRIDTWKWGGQVLLFNSTCYVILFVLDHELSDSSLLVAKVIWYFLPLIMGTYGSLIIINIAKRIGNFHVLRSNKVYKTFSKDSYELYLFSDPFNYILIYMMYVWMGDYVIDNVASLLSFLIRFFGTIFLAFVVIWIKNKIMSVIFSYGTIRKS